MEEIKCEDCSAVVSITVVSANHQPVPEHIYCPICGSKDTHVVG